MSRFGKQNRGMTLIEILIVIGVLSILSGLMYQIMVDMQKENRRALGEMEVVMALDSALEALSFDLESVLPPVDGKEPSADEFQIVKQSKDGGSEDRIVYQRPIETDDGKIAVSKRETSVSIKDGEPALVQKDIEGAAGNPALASRALARIPERYSLYFDVKWGVGEAGKWNDTWSRKDGVPERIYVTLTARLKDSPDRPSEIKLGKTIYLMAM